MSDEQLLSITEAARWLTAHGIAVRSSRTVYEWIRVGRVPAVRADLPRTQKGRKPERFIALSTLEHIAACPFCASR